MNPVKGHRDVASEWMAGGRKFAEKKTINAFLKNHEAYEWQ